MDHSDSLSVGTCREVRLTRHDSKTEPALKNDVSGGRVAYIHLTQYTTYSKCLPTTKPVDGNSQNLTQVSSR